MSFVDTIKSAGGYVQNKALNLGEYARDGLHAMPAANPNVLKTIPSMHRLFNAMGMIALWLVGSKIFNLIFGMKPDGTEIDIKDVPKPFRPLHGIIKYNAFGDAPYDKWCKITHQLGPAAFGAFGAIYGSKLFFVQNGRDAKYKQLMGKKTLNPLEADDAASYTQALPMRIIAGLFAIFGSVSALTPVYGFFLNPSFALASNRKMWAGAAEQFGIEAFRKPTNTTSAIAFGPGEATQHVINKFQSFFYQAAKEGSPEKAGDKLAEGMMDALVRPLMPKLNEHDEKTMRATIKELFEKEFAKEQATGKTPEEVAKAASAKLTDYFTSPNKDGKKIPSGYKLMRALGIGEDKYKELVKDMVAGNNGWFAKMAEWFGFKGRIKEIHAKLSADTLGIG